MIMLKRYITILTNPTNIKNKYSTKLTKTKLQSYIYNDNGFKQKHKNYKMPKRNITRETQLKKNIFIIYIYYQLPHQHNKAISP